MPTETNTSTEVKTSTPIAQKLAIMVMMLGAISALAAIVVGLTYQLPKEKTKPVTGPVAFKPLQLTDGAPSTTSLKDSGLAEFEFLRDGVVMATYNKSSDSVFKENENLDISYKNSLNPFFVKEASAATMYSIEDITNGSFEPGDTIDLLSKSPLQVKISQSVLETADIPALTFSLVTNIGNKTLCVPANILSENIVVSYYYDMDGTPYFNSKLTQKAMAGKCTVNTQAYAPTDISAITITPEYPPEVPNGFQMYFVRYDQTMMAYANKTFVPFESNLIAGGKSSLAISTGYYDAEKAKITVPARILLMETDLGFLNVCLPEQTIAGTWADVDNRYFGKGAVYYLDKNGTPYVDELLTQPAISTACHVLLNKAYLPKDITQIEMAPFENQSPTSYIMMYIRRSEQNLMLFAQNTFQKPTGGEPLTFASGDQAPLIIHPGYEDTTNSVYTIPTRYLTVYSDLGAHTLCLPGQTITGTWNDNLSTPAYLGPGTAFYFDKDGNPYSDTLLLNPVDCEAEIVPTNTNSANSNTNKSTGNINISIPEY